MESFEMNKLMCHCLNTFNKHQIVKLKLQIDLKIVKIFAYKRSMFSLFFHVPAWTTFYCLEGLQVMRRFVGNNKPWKIV